MTTQVKEILDGYWKEIGRCLISGKSTKENTEIEDSSSKRHINERKERKERNEKKKSDRKTTMSKRIQIETWSAFQPLDWRQK